MYYTITVTKEELDAIIEETVDEINAFANGFFTINERSPFGIIYELEALDEKLDADVCCFHLTVSPDYTIKDEYHAVRFCAEMKKAAEAVESMNEQLYVIPKKRKAGPMRH